MQPAPVVIEAPASAPPRVIEPPDHDVGYGAARAGMWPYASPGNLHPSVAEVMRSDGKTTLRSWHADVEAKSSGTAIGTYKPYGEYIAWNGSAQDSFDVDLLVGVQLYRSVVPRSTAMHELAKLAKAHPSQPPRHRYDIERWICLALRRYCRTHTDPVPTDAEDWQDRHWCFEFKRFPGREEYVRALRDPDGSDQCSVCRIAAQGPMDRRVGYVKLSTDFKPRGSTVPICYCLHHLPPGAFKDYRPSPVPGHQVTGPVAFSDSFDAQRVTTWEPWLRNFWQQPHIEAGRGLLLRPCHVCSRPMAWAYIEQLEKSGYHVSHRSKHEFGLT